MEGVRHFQFQSIVSVLTEVGTCHDLPSLPMGHKASCRSRLEGWVDPLEKDIRGGPTTPV